MTLTNDRDGHGAAAILLVEDDTETRRSIATFLRGHDHEVVEAGDAATATAEWERRRPDLLVLDLGLPDEDGLVVIRHIRREATTPILVLSARDRERDKVAALDSRCGRLRHQAVRDGRASRPHRRAASPSGRSGR